VSGREKLKTREAKKYKIPHPLTYPEAGVFVLGSL
jgi:hypothetical protein